MVFSSGRSLSFCLTVLVSQIDHLSQKLNAIDRGLFIKEYHRLTRLTTPLSIESSSVELVVAVNYEKENHKILLVSSLAVLYDCVL